MRVAVRVAYVRRFDKNSTDLRELRVAMQDVHQFEFLPNLPGNVLLLEQHLFALLSAGQYGPGRRHGELRSL